MPVQAETCFSYDTSSQKWYKGTSKDYTVCEVKDFNLDKAYIRKGNLISGEERLYFIGTEMYRDSIYYLDGYPVDTKLKRAKGLYKQYKTGKTDRYQTVLEEIIGDKTTFVNGGPLYTYISEDSIKAYKYIYKHFPKDSMEYLIMKDLLTLLKENNYIYNKTVKEGYEKILQSIPTSK